VPRAGSRRRRGRLGTRREVRFRGLSLTGHISKFFKILVKGVLSTKLERKVLTFHAKYTFCFQILKYDKISERERKDPASGNIRPGG